MVKKLVVYLTAELGNGALDFFAKIKIPFKPINDILYTADGASQHIHGVVCTEISYLKITKKFRLYIVPSLSQKLY